MNATWNSWLEAPKSMNAENAIRKYCISTGIKINSLYSKDNPRDFMDKLLAIKRETVYFELEGPEDVMRNLQSELEKRARSKKIDNI
jgi:hypothetical protein